MADDSQDISDYRDAIKGMLLDGETLEATLPGSYDIAPDSTDHPRALGVTSRRLILCYRRLKRGDSDEWRFTSIPYSSIGTVELTRREQFRRDRIDASSSIGVRLSVAMPERHGSTFQLELAYHDAVLAREVHDRILAHMLAAQ